jgi:hypothetical protein
MNIPAALSTTPLGKRRAFEDVNIARRKRSKKVKPAPKV